MAWGREWRFISHVIVSRSPCASQSGIKESKLLKAKKPHGSPRSQDRALSDSGSRRLSVLRLTAIRDACSIAGKAAVVLRAIRSLSPTPLSGEQTQCEPTPRPIPLGVYAERQTCRCSKFHAWLFLNEPDLHGPNSLRQESIVLHGAVQARSLQRHSQTIAWFRASSDLVVQSMEGVSNSMYSLSLKICFDSGHPL